MKHKRKPTHRKRLPLTQLACGAFGGVVGLGIGFFAAKYIDTMQADGFHFFSIAALLLAIGCAIYVQLIVHELGHLVFGLLTGYRFSSFRIGCLMLMKQDGALRFKKFSLAGTAGQCLLAPPLRSNTKPYVLYHFGGCIANVLVSLVALGLWFVGMPTLFLPLFCMALTTFGLLFALMNGIPMQLGVANDGYNALAQKKNPQAIDTMWIQLKTNEYLSQGGKLSEMPTDWLYMPDDEGLHNILIATIGVFYANQLLVRQQFPQTRTAIERLLADDTNLCDLHRKMLVCDKIYCLLLSGADAETIDALYTKAQAQFMAQMKTFPTILRTQYALDLLHRNNEERAQKTRATFDKIARHYPYPGDIADERMLMDVCADVQRKNNLSTL